LVLNDSNILLELEENLDSIVALDAALSGRLLEGDFWTDPIFRFEVPKHCNGVPDDILNPAESWPSTKEYMVKYRQLALHFIANFRKFQESCPELVKAGPLL
jgi:phosphoenolpyruvate carboxykinase (ATP)